MRHEVSYKIKGSDRIYANYKTEFEISYCSEC